MNIDKKILYIQPAAINNNLFIFIFHLFLFADASLTHPPPLWTIRPVLSSVERLVAALVRLPTAQWSVVLPPPSVPPSANASHVPLCPLSSVYLRLAALRARWAVWCSVRPASLNTLPNI